MTAAKEWLCTCRDVFLGPCVGCRLNAAVAGEREACAAELQKLLDDNFYGTDIEALREGIAAIRARGGKKP